MKYISVPNELEKGLQYIAHLLPKENIPVRFEHADCLCVRKDEDEVVIGYSRKTVERFE